MEAPRAPQAWQPLTVLLQSPAHMWPSGLWGRRAPGSGVPFLHISVWAWTSRGGAASTTPVWGCFWVFLHQNWLLESNKSPGLPETRLNSVAWRSSAAPPPGGPGAPVPSGSSGVWG